MAAIPYLWYWIVGGLVAVLIATVAIFSERINPDLVGNKTISSEIEDSSGADLDEIVPKTTPNLGSCVREPSGKSRLLIMTIRIRQHGLSSFS